MLTYVEKSKSHRYFHLNIGDLNVDLVLIHHAPKESFPFKLLDHSVYLVARANTGQP